MGVWNRDSTAFLHLGTIQMIGFLFFSSEFKGLAYLPKARVRTLELFLKMGLYDFSFPCKINQVGQMGLVPNS